MSNDHVADMLSSIRNAYKAQLPLVTIPFSGLLVDMCKVLEEEGFIRTHRVTEDGAKKNLVIELKYLEGEPAIRELKRVSKSGLRKYAKVSNLPKHYNGLGISIVSTSKGVMSDFSARQQKVGGEVLCTVF
ncbi:MAG: 30S ribosomal protein S8 [Alphaproteobacteria bacterium]|nr:30S ribosomal protein S8 [Alphaproteobacteria bacterium]